MTQSLQKYNRNFTSYFRQIINVIDECLTCPVVTIPCVRYSRDSSLQHLLRTRLVYLSYKLSCEHFVLKHDLFFCIRDSKLYTRTIIKARTGSLISLVSSRKCCLPCSHKQHSERSEAVGVQSPPRSGTKNRKRLTGSRLLHDTQGPASSPFLTRDFTHVQFFMAVT